MKQSRLGSLSESVVNVIVGFGISLAAQAAFLPLLGVTISLAQNLVFAVIMTAISIARSYALRRLFEALHIRVPLSPAMLAVIAERRRQVGVEGWTAEHDDGHVTGDLARAGACYLAEGAVVGGPPPPGWPWDDEWWKPRDGARRNFVKGCALGLAEIEKWDRSRKPQRRAT